MLPTSNPRSETYYLVSEVGQAPSVSNLRLLLDSRPTHRVPGVNSPLSSGYHRLSVSDEADLTGS